MSFNSVEARQCSTFLLKKPIIIQNKSALLHNTVQFEKLKLNEKYQDLTLMVEDLKSKTLNPSQLAGEIFTLPQALGLRPTLTEGRMVRFESPSYLKKGVIFMIGGLFNGAEKMLSNENLIKENLEKGFDVIYLEMTQGYVAAREILNNNLRSPGNINHLEQQSLLAYSMLKAIETYKLSPSTPKILLGHSYGGWLINSFASNPQYNGKSSVQNPLFKHMLSDLYQKGLLKNPDFSEALHALIPMDSGLGAIHLHPAVAAATQFMKIDFWLPMAKVSEDITLSYVLRQGLLAESPRLRQDPYSLDNAVALYLGIRNQNVIDAPQFIPSSIRVLNIIAGQSQLIPEVWHAYYTQALNSTSKGPTHRATIVIDNAPHEFLFMKNLGFLMTTFLEGHLNLKTDGARIVLSNVK